MTDMVPDLARMAVIIKSQHDTSVMTGNYELGYTCGLLCKLTGISVPVWETPGQLQEKILQEIEKYQPADDREKNVIHMLKYYKADETYDEQVRLMFEMGMEEEHVWRAIVK